MVPSASHPLAWKLPFFTVWGGQQVSYTGSSIAQFALVWWVTETTGSATALATAIMVALLPGVLIGPFAGVLVDRWNRRLVLIVADSAVALLSAWIAYLFWRDLMQIWYVYLFMALRAVGNTFHWAAMMASTSLMVPEEHLPRVAGLNQTMGGATEIITPPVAALLLAFVSISAIMVLDVVTAAFAVLPLLFIAIPQPARKMLESGAASLLADATQGIRYIWQRPGLRALCLMVMLISFLTVPAYFLMPILVVDHFSGSAYHLGWMNSVWGVGLMAGGLLLSSWGGYRRQVQTILAGAIGIGISYALVGFMPSSMFWLALLWLFWGAVMNSLARGSYVALLQRIIPAELQGRVLTLVTSLTSAMMPLGMAAAGPLADAVGTRWLYVLAGTVQVVVVLAAAALTPILRVEESNRVEGTST